MTNIYFKPFSTKEEVLAHIVEGKPASCADRLESHLLQGIGEGLDNNVAAERALLLHAHLDHKEGIDFGVDPNYPFTTVEEVKNAYSETLLERNFDGRAQERVDLVCETFDRYLSWGASLAYASEIAWIWSAEKWSDENVTDDE